MRLICPNCGAQYEVGADVIPEDGRDVQCSSCGHTWYENPQDPSADFEDDGFAPEPTKPEAVTPPPPKRTQLDPSIADILREEAAREEAVRRSESSSAGLEQQEELGLADPVPAPPPAARKVDPIDEGRSRIDRLQGRPTPDVVAPVGSRKELFPDIEEINSTLRSSADRNDLSPLHGESDADARHSSLRGFIAMIGLIVVLGLIYGFADTIMTAVPALTDALTSYVAAVDAGRLWLDTRVQALLGDPANA